MRTRAQVQTFAFLGLGLVAGVLLVGFRVGGDEVRRPGLERYDPRAIAAVGGKEAMPSSNAEVAAVMEVRDLCRSLDRLAGRPGSAKAFRARVAGSEEALGSFAAVDGSRPDISAFTRLAVDQAARAEEQGRGDAIATFLDAECDPTQDYAQPVLAGDR